MNVLSTHDADAIAVVGMAGRFPGACNVDELWRNLAAGVESIRRFSEAEMRAAGVDPAWLGDPRHVPVGGVLDEADLFDAGLFQVTPREAELLDPQHRQFLECAWEALEDAGCDPARAAAQLGPIGVFAGASQNSYLLYHLLPRGELPALGADPQVVMASEKDFLTTRVSYKLNLTGPSLDVQTACSTSLVAVALACQSLLNYQCDLALAGGVTVREPQRTGYLYQEQGVLSPDGHCRPFDAAARGSVPSNGVGVVALKRLDQALADRDAVRAVIRGAAMNNDGAAKVGYTAPSARGQSEVVALALAVAGLRPRDISYVEAHGTATPLGDPIELAALDRVFGADTEERGFCTLGAIKSNLGHLDAAAGIAGLIKTVLALERRQIPPTLHWQRTNPQLDLGQTAFRINGRLEPWETDRLPRRAGVSSFGIGGTNVHVVLEEAPAPGCSAAAGERGDGEEAAVARPELLLLSARSLAALDVLTGRLGERLQARAELRLADVGRTLRRGRRQLAARRTVVAHSRDEAVAALAGAVPGTALALAAAPSAAPAALALAAAPSAAPTARTAVVDGGEREVVFLFPGQGTQHAGMTAELYAAEPIFRREIDAACELLRPILGLDLAALLVPGPGEEAMAERRLGATELGQPALFVVEHALARLWMAWGIRPAALLGASVGEYVAACLAGVMALPRALGLVALRGRLMAALPPGAMLAVPLAATEVEPLLDAELALAAVNAPDRVVVAGPPAAVERLGERLASRGIAALQLPVEHAFHSAAVEAIVPTWMAAVAGEALAPPTVPYLSTVTGTWATAEQAVSAAFWAEHLRAPVRLAPALGELLREPRRVLLEVGPGQTLTSLARRHPVTGGARTVLASQPPRDRRSGAHAHLLDTLGRLWLAGVEIDWAAFHPEHGRSVSLPTYPFEHQRYWLEAPATAAASRGAGDAASRGEGGERWPDDGWLARREAELPARTSADDPTALAALDALCTSAIVRSLADRGIAVARGEEIELAELRRRLRLQPRYERLLGRLLAFLAADGVIAGAGWEAAAGTAAGLAATAHLRFARSAADIGTVTDRRREVERLAPELAGLCELLDHVTASYPRVLSGEVDALEILYPDGSPELLERAVAAGRAAAQVDPAPTLLGDLLAAAAATVPAGRPLSILEVGAGQGVLTRELVPRLVGSAVEYQATDLGRSFVLRAERVAAAAGWGDMRFGVLDIARDPLAQGYPARGFDVVVGANVVHATPRIAATLAHLRSLLAPGGLLALVETVRLRRWGEMIWGLTDGWWHFEDTELRTVSPLLTTTGWLDQLACAGFTATAWPRDPAVRESTDSLLLLGRLPAAGAGVPASPGAPEGGGDTPLHERPQLLAPYAAPRDEVEKAVAAIWSRALGIAPVGVHDNFMELGGDSLTGLRVLREIGDRFPLPGRRLSLYESPTVAAIAAALHGAAEPEPSLARRESRGRLRREHRQAARRARP